MSDNGGERAAEIDEEEQEEEVDAVAMEAIREALRGTTLKFMERGDVKGLFANVRSFAKQSQGNDTVQEVCFKINRQSDA
jgi:GTP cyclohydrolase II